MNDRQLLCFLTVAQTCNFSRAARQLYITQPALSYQIHSLEKELGAELFERSTTYVRLTEAGCAFAGPAREMYRCYLAGCSAVKPFIQMQQLTLLLPTVMIRRDPIYHTLMQRIHQQLPELELVVRVDPAGCDLYRTLCGEADLVLTLARENLAPEVHQDLLFHTPCCIVAGPDHPLFGQGALPLAQLHNQTVCYEPGELAQHLKAQAARQQILPHWLEVPSYEQAYALLLAGRGVFLSPMQYASFPPEWCLPLELAEPFPDTCLFSLKNERRPQVHALIRLICETYREQFGPV